MEIIDYVKSLLPNIDRANILSDIDRIEETLQKHAVPAYQAALSAGLFGSQYQFRSKWADTKVRDFAQQDRRVRENLYEVIVISLGKANEHLNFIRKNVENGFTGDLARDGITYPKAVQLQLLEAISFFVSYSRKFLLLTYCYECPEYMKSQKFESPFPKIQLKLIEEKFPAFVSLLRIFGPDTNDTLRYMTEIPDLVVDSDLHDATAAINGSTKLDPTAVGFIKYTWNPIYHLRMAVVNYQQAQADAAHEEMQALQLRLLQLKQLRDGQENAALEQQIEYTETRIMKLNTKIAKMEG